MIGRLLQLSSCSVKHRSLINYYTMESLDGVIVMFDSASFNVRLFTWFGLGRILIKSAEMLICTSVQIMHKTHSKFEIK